VFYFICCPSFLAYRLSSIVHRSLFTIHCLLPPASYIRSKIYLSFPYLFCYNATIINCYPKRRILRDAKIIRK
jgi:hypothetical protein